MNAVAPTVTAQPSERPPAPAPVVAQVASVSKQFGAVQAVRDVSLEVRQGELVTLLGPSGCGKTTVLRLVMGLERCDAGQIVYQGRVVDSPDTRVFVPPEKRHMGMVFQSYAIWPHMTVFENVAYPLQVRRVRGAALHQQVGHVLELVGLGGVGDRPATRLSGGQQQRVAFARSLVFQPDLLLLDEPFSNLDARLREQMRLEVKLLQRQLGIAVLFVTHDQAEALSLSDRLAVMNEGRIEQIGSPHAVYDRPATPFVRDFLGRSILLPGTVVDASPTTGVRVVLTDKPAVTVRAPHPLSFNPLAGERCQLAVRPERLSVHAGVEAAATPGALPAIIDTLLFLGDYYEAALRLPGEQTVLVRLPRTSEWQENQRVTLVIPEGAVCVWPP